MKKRYNYDTSYSDGFEDVEDDFDFDADRYDSDEAYADGVEDAFDEFGED